MNNEKAGGTWKAPKAIQIVAVLLTVAGLGWYFLSSNHSGKLDDVQLASLSGSDAVPTIRVAYLIPSDQAYRAEYEKSMISAMESLKGFYASQLDGANFTYTVRRYRLPKEQTARWFQGNGQPGDYWERALAGGFAATGGFFDDPNNRWIFLVDAPILSNQYAGGTNGVAVLHQNDIQGLAGLLPGQPVGRFIGGLGHEIGHALTLPHPSDCPGPAHCSTDLMYLGYLIYPNNVRLTQEDKATLRQSQFFQAKSIEPKKYVPLLDAVEKELTKPAATDGAKAPDTRTPTTNNAGDSKTSPATRTQADTI